MIDIIGLVSGSLSGPLADVIWTSPLTVGTRALITQDACTWDNEDSMAKNVWMLMLVVTNSSGGCGGQTLQWLRAQKLRISLYEHIAFRGSCCLAWRKSECGLAFFTCCQQLSRTKNKNKLLISLNLFSLQTLFSLKVNSESDPLLVIGWNVFCLCTC